MNLTHRLFFLCILLEAVPVPARAEENPPGDAYQTALVAARARLGTAEYAAAVQTAHDALLAADPGPPVTRLIRVHLDLARNLLPERKRMVDALSHLQVAMKLAEPLGDARLVTQILLLRGQVHFGGGQGSAAAQDYNLAIAMAETSDDLSLLAQALQGRGRSAFQFGNFRAAVAAYERLLALDPSVAEYERTTALLEFGRTLGRGGQLDRAVSILQQALALAADTPARQAEIEQALGDAYNRAGLPDPAAQHYQAALELLDLAASPPSLRLLRDLSRNLREAQRPAEAATILARGLPLAEAAEDVPALIGLLEDLAALQAGRGDMADAYARLERAHALTVKHRMVSQVVPGASHVEQPALDRFTEAAMLAVNQRALQEAALRRRQLERNLGLVSGGAALLIAGLALVAYRYKRRAAATAELARTAAELRADRAQLAMLRYQLNPHLLFNTLNSIRSLALTDPGKARDLVSRLSAFCRRALTPADSPLVPLREEWAALTDYLELERARWEDLLTVEAALDPALGDLPVPPLLLQPLVENAIKYGQQTTTGDLHIRVTAVRADASLRLTVANTGRWITPTAAPDAGSTHIGLTNVRQRLATFYGDQARVTSAETDGWVTVTVDLPGEQPVSPVV